MARPPIAVALLVLSFYRVDGATPHKLASKIASDRSIELSWHLDAVGLTSNQRGSAQSHYQIRLFLDNVVNSSLVYYSARIASRDSWTNVLSTISLSPHTIYKWQVRVWSELGVSRWSDWHSLIVPMISWPAPWITQDQVSSSDAKSTLMRKSFAVRSSLTQAVLSISGLGQYELSINGQRVGDHQLDPGWTKYDKTCLYSTYDVAGMLTNGDNAMGVLLGNGMYHNLGDRYAKWRGSSGPRTLTLHLTLRYADNSTETVQTDTSWQSRFGPITFNSIYGGEDHDAREEVEGWNTVDGISIQGDGWSLVTLYSGPGCTVQPQLQPPVKIREVIKTVNFTQHGNARVYDFGTEFSGWPVLSVKATNGTSIIMTPAEFLTADGMIDQRFKPAYWKYTARGGGSEIWRPRFYTSGFRYLKVESPSGAQRFVKGSGAEIFLENKSASLKNHVPRCNMCGDPCKQYVVVDDSYLETLKDGAEFDCAMLDGDSLPELSLTGEFVYTSAELVGNFSCSQPLFNRIHSMILGAMKSNLQSIFTDCPHRERLGWLEQSWLLQESVAKNFDVSSLYAKIVRDIADSQLENGMVPDIAPEYVVFNGGFRDSPEWGLAIVNIPLFLQEHYGDNSTLVASYNNMSAYIQYLMTKSSKGILAYGLGDWTSAGDKSPIGVTATMVYYEGLLKMAKAARYLGKIHDEQQFLALANKSAAAYNAKWLDETSGGYVNSQTATAMALALSVAPDVKKSLNWLTTDIYENSNHTIVGEIGWPYVVRALATHDQDEVLSAIASRTDKPSYGYQLTQGATTLTESWVADRSVSWNHAMDGHIDSWFYTHVAGIRSLYPLAMRPVPHSDLEYAEASQLARMGNVTIRWERDSDRFKVLLTLPPGAEARLTLPTKRADAVTESGSSLLSSDIVSILEPDSDGSIVCLVPSGSYEFRMVLETTELVV